MSDVRAKAIEVLRGYDGVSVSTSRDRYVELLGPDEAKPMRDYFCDPTTSGCALTIRGLWRTLGVQDSRLLPPYKFGTAISLLVAIARERGAWTSLVKAQGGGALPQVGDFVLVGGDKTKDGGVEHVFTVTECSLSGDSVLLASIDGGQRDAKGQQAIYAKRRRWSLSQGSWWDVSEKGSDPGASAPRGRRVMGFGNIEKIFTFGANA